MNSWAFNSKNKDLKELVNTSFKVQDLAFN